MSFSKAFAQIFADRLRSNAATFAEIMQQVSGRRPDDSTPEQTELRAKARNILRASQPLLEDALRKESELTGRPFAQQMKELDEALISRRNSLAEHPTGDATIVESIEHIPNGISTPEPQDVEMEDVSNQIEIEPETTIALDAEKPAAGPELAAPHLVAANTPPASTNGIVNSQSNGEATQNGVVEPVSNAAPPTPPMSLEGQGTHPALGTGGIPWYVEQFDPFGTTIYEERWTGQQVLREMSEELSEMDEDELQGLGPDEIALANGLVEDEINVLPADSGPVQALKKPKNGKGRKSNNGWSRAGKPRRYR